MKLKSDNGIIDFLKNGGGKGKIWIALLIGAALILLGSRTSTTEQPKDADTAAALAEICSLAEGVGRCEVMLTYGEGGEVTAALVLCDGAESASVRARVVSMISTLFGIGTHKIEVVKISR